MAVLNAIALPDDPGADSAATGTAIEAWTEETATALGNLTISYSMNTQGNSVTLQIPLDEEHGNQPRPSDKPVTASVKPASHVRSGEILRRDSLKRRESLLKGKDGSRRRQRWENGAETFLALALVFMDLCR